MTSFNPYTQSHLVGKGLFNFFCYVDVEFWIGKQRHNNVRVL